MTEGQARNLVNSAALVVAAIYFYRKLIEPAAGQAATASASPAPGTEPAAGEAALERPIFNRFRGPRGSFAGFNDEGEPATIGGAAAQLLGEGKPPSTERFVVGWGFVFLTLSLTVPASPQLAGSFAALVMLGSVLTNGSQVAKDLRSQLRSSPNKNTAGPSTASPTTTVSYAGASAQPSVPAVLMPERAPRKKKSAAPKFKVQSA